MTAFCTRSRRPSIRGRLSLVQPPIYPALLSARLTEMVLLVSHTSQKKRYDK